MTSGARSGNYCRNIFGQTVPTEPGRVAEHRRVMTRHPRIEGPHLTQFPVVDLHHFGDAGELIGKRTWPASQQFSMYLQSSTVRASAWR